MTVLLVLWLVFWFLVVPAFGILRIVGLLPTPGEERLEQEAREKTDSCETAMSWGAGKRLALAGILFLGLLSVYGLIHLVFERHWDEAIGSAFRRIVGLALPILVLWYLTTGCVLRRRRKALERRLAVEQRSSCSALERIVRDHADLDWTAYARYSIWRGRALLGTSFALQVICVTTAILIFVLGFQADFRWLKGYYILGTFTIAATVFIAVKLSRKARPHYARLELEHMISSRLPPVLFLRAFVSDRESFDSPDNVFGNPLRWIDWKIEDVLAQEFRSYGPVVALGQAEFALAPSAPCAVRLFVRTGWTKTVQELCELSRMIVVRASFSDGVKWELNEVLRADRMAKAVILLVDDQGKPMQKSEYLRFRDHVAKECRLELPLKGWSSWYIWFDEKGTSKLIEAPPGEAGFGLQGATQQLIDELTRAAKAKWQRLSVWDFYTPFEYRVLAWGLPMTLAALIAAWLLYYA